MIALDTNVIIRFLVRDDERQAKRVYARFKRAETARERLFVPLLVLLETLWVLESAYDMSRNDILDALEDLRQMPIFDFEADRVLDLLITSGRQTAADLLTCSSPILQNAPGAISYSLSTRKRPNCLSFTL